MRLTDHLDPDDRLSIRDGDLLLEDCSLTEVARRYGTPLHVVSQERLQLRAREIVREFGAAWTEGSVQVLASLKANFSLALRRLLTLEGIGCDTFGASELRAALACGVPPALVSVNGSSKSAALVREAIAAGAHITLDSLREAELVTTAARELDTTATVRVRLRPDLSALGMSSEFAADRRTVADVADRYKPGVPRDDLPALAGALRASHLVTVAGCHAHVGRHRPDLAFWQAVVPCLVAEIARFAEAMGDGWRPQVIDLGGGYSPRRDPAELAHGDGLAGEPRAVPAVSEYARAVTSSLRSALSQAGLPAAGVTLQIEPGRGLYANAGLHLARVTNLKTERRASGVQRWIETDTSEAFLPDVNLEGVRWNVLAVHEPERPPQPPADIAGISCGFDLLVADARLPQLEPGDLIAFLDTGAYQDAGSYNFNAMPRPATVLVVG
ncbi:MAG TPA: hypothetical protein VK576_03710, partial [Thermoleophilia bacterium]|nr:hypothetical protein [Thermoleophilia bacterium]